jgi:hypothetical protein
MNSTFAAVKDNEFWSNIPMAKIVAFIQRFMPPY